MNQSPTPQIKLIHIFLSRRDAAKYPWRKEVAELRHDLAAADGYTVNPKEIAKELAISPEQIANLESGEWSTDAEGWRRFEAAVRKVHEAVGKAREARANAARNTPLGPVV